jgi:hypothetical protein
LLVAEKAVTNLTVDAGPASLLAGLALFAGHRDVKCRQHACLAIGNLCSNVANLEAVVTAGCVPTLVAFAYPSADAAVNVQFQAVAALRGLAAHDTIRVRLLREHVLQPLMMLATAKTAGAPLVGSDDAAADDGSGSKTASEKDGQKDAEKKDAKRANLGRDESAVGEAAAAELEVDKEVQREVAAALMNLAGAEENKVKPPPPPPPSSPVHTPRFCCKAQNASKRLPVAHGPNQHPLSLNRNCF